MKAWIFALACLGASAAGAASFPCQRAATYVERAICADATLGRMDEAMARNYSRMLGARGISRGRVVRQQHEWLAERDRCRSRQCLLAAYRARLDDMCDYGYAPGARPRCTRAAQVR